MFFTVAEDFRRHTLKALPTLVEKLAYISSLQDVQGRYMHWGLSRIFGDHKAQQGISTVHSELATQLIRLPVRSTYQEYSGATEEGRHSHLLDPEFFSLKAPSNGDELLSAHLQLIRDSIVTLAGRESTTQQVA
jgi:hypothetical protein